ncbi:MAG: YjfK family protein [Alphaproteobacteria bacterium]|nr:YjfK family protein [Alphaproteobacteria bacterium]MBU1515005.1 YjfK family protein [Alphaproteobacteria bacterium]MBU2095654.1 YjfK family protein [Alphaproteobacteria bacterium]MBU2151042.1 YjfK family protein [Alphaproteobacteria bacterium]MBU2306905.1 YjfK family protein [Alphaproteobacteria bacterium]
MFRGLFGGRKDEARVSAVPVVRNVTIGRSVRLDPLAWRRYGGDTRVKLKTDVLNIVAQGVIDLGADGFVHRFYTEDDLMLQMVSPDAAGLEADDFTVFVPWASAYPPDARARREWADRLRARTFTDADLPEYRRFWFGDTDERQDPVSFWEEVYDDRSGRDPRRIYQTSMLFARDLPGDGRELLLAIEMEPEGGDLTHEIMVGIPLNIGEFQA